MTVQTSIVNEYYAPNFSIKYFILIICLDQPRKNLNCKSKCNEKLDSVKNRAQMKKSARLAKKSYLIEGKSKNEKVVTVEELQKL